jgi:hypothetical protein
LRQGDEIFLTPQNFIEFWRSPHARWKRTVSAGPASGRRKKSPIYRRGFPCSRIRRRYSLAGWNW